MIKHERRTRSKFIGSMGKKQMNVLLRYTITSPRATALLISGVRFELFSFKVGVESFCIRVFIVVGNDSTVKPLLSELIGTRGSKVRVMEVKGQKQ